MKKQISKAIKIVKQDNGAVVFDKDTGMYLQTNDVGVCILEKLSESYTVEKIVKNILAIYSKLI